MRRRSVTRWCCSIGSAQETRHYALESVAIKAIDRRFLPTTFIWDLRSARVSHRQARRRPPGEIRKMVKPISLGVIYGMTKYGAAAQTGKSLAWAATALAGYEHAYPTLMNYLKDVAAQAVFDRRIVSFFGWPMAVHGGTKTRTLFNFTAQANGAEMMRITAIAAHEAGIQVCAPVHDAFWFLAPLDGLDRTIAQMTSIMERAGHAVCRLTIPVEIAYVVKYPQCLGDVRGKRTRAMRCGLEIQELIDSGELKTEEAAE